MQEEIRVRVQSQTHSESDKTKNHGRYGPDRSVRLYHNRFIPAVDTVAYVTDISRLIWYWLDSFDIKGERKTRTEQYSLCLFTVLSYSFLFPLFNFIRNLYFAYKVLSVFSPPFTLASQKARWKKAEWIKPISNSLI